MPVLSTLHIRVGFVLVIAVGVLATAGLPSASADLIGEKNDGPAGEYSGSCGGKKSDPVGIVFRGKASVLNTRETIAERTGWRNVDTGLTVFGHRVSSDKQELSVRQSNGKYACDENQMAIAEAGGANSRHHVRLWRAYSKTGNVVTVGTPHHEDFVMHNPLNNHCELIPGILSIGNHAVDRGGVNQSDDSGFDQARHKIKKDFSDAGYEISSENWGNTVEFEQCDEDKAGSDGYGVTVTLVYALHAHSNPATEMSKASAKLNGELLTEEPTTEYWFAYGPKPSQGASGYPNKTAVTTVSGPAEIGVSEVVSGLAMSGTYYFRMFARNPAGKVVEGDEIAYRLCLTPDVNTYDNGLSPGPRSIVTCDGSVHVFYRTPSNTLGHKWYQTGNTVWGSENLGGSVASEPNAIVDKKGNIHVFYRTASGTLGHSWWQTGGTVWGSENLGGSVVGEPQAVVDPTSDALHVFHRTSTGTVRHRWWATGATVWGGETLWGSPASDPRPVVDKKGNINVFFRTTGGSLGHVWWQVGGSVWGGENLGGSVVGEPLTVVDPTNDALHVFHRTASGTLRHRWWAWGGTLWGDETLWGSPASDPHPVVDKKGNINVFFRTTSGSLGHVWWQVGGSVWGGEDLGGSVVGDPQAMVNPKDDAVHVLHRNSSGGIQHRWWAWGGTLWGSETLWGSPASEPHLIADNGGNINSLFRTPSGTVGHVWWQEGGSLWGGEDLGGPVAE